METNKTNKGNDKMMIGTEKQIKWAVEIVETANETIENLIAKKTAKIEKYEGHLLEPTISDKQRTFKKSVLETMTADKTKLRTARRNLQNLSDAALVIEYQEYLLDPARDWMDEDGPAYKGNVYRRMEQGTFNQ